MVFSAGAAGGAGATLGSAGGAWGLVGRRARPARRYPRGRTWSFSGRYGLWKVWSSKFGRFAMVYVDLTLHFSIFVDHLVLIGYAADAIRSFPSRRQLGGTFGRGGEGED